MKFLIFGSLFFWGFSASAKEMSLLEAYSYRQDKLQLQDAYSDEVLLRRVERAKYTLSKGVFGSAGEEISRDLHYKEAGLPDKGKSAQTRFEGYQNPYIVEGFLNMFLQIMSEESRNGLLPTSGEFHRWSHETLKKHRFNMVTKFDKILVALALGVTYHVMFTGEEERLKEYLLTQEDKSVPFHELFRISYRLNNGNVYLAILTMENLFSRNWKSPHRDNLPHFKKLIPMISHFNEGGDSYGSYYHFLGVLLYGYVKGEFSARTVGFIEGVGSQILSKFQDEKQENFANKMGGIIGAKLRKTLRKDKFGNFVPDSAYLLESNYLNQSEDFRDRFSYLKSPDLILSVSLNDMENKIITIGLLNTERELKDCTLEFFVKDWKKSKTTFFSMKGNLGPRKKFYFSENYRGLNPVKSEVRVFVSNCLNSDYEGVQETKGWQLK